MYCPRCGLEFKMVTACRDCGVPLESARPEPSDDDAAPEAESGAGLETVLATRDNALLSIVASRLDAAGIPCVVEGVLSDLIGWGPFGFGGISGPARIHVPRERAEEARRVLAATDLPLPEAAFRPDLLN